MKINHLSRPNLPAPPPPQDKMVIPKVENYSAIHFPSEVICFRAHVSFTYSARLHVAMRPQQKNKVIC